MNRNQRTLKKIFENPIRSDILWKDVVSLIEYLGGQVIEGSGSRVRFVLNGMGQVLHTPHPQKEIRKAMVKTLRDYLKNAGK